MTKKISICFISLLLSTSLAHAEPNFPGPNNGPGFNSPQGGKGEPCSVPEIDGNVTTLGLGLLASAMAMIGERRRKKASI
jgi:hypothetical protein